MTTTEPLFFPQALNERGLWRSLGVSHSLSPKDFAWLANVELSTDERRQQQVPPMSAHRLSLGARGQLALPLAGSFMLSPTPDDNGAILYTPYGGIQKFDGVDSLKASLILRLANPADRSVLLHFVPLARRIAWADDAVTEITQAVIAGAVFEDQKALILGNQRENAQQLLAELLQLPSFSALLDDILDDGLRSIFPGTEQSLTRANFFTQSDTGREWIDSLPLREALLLHYRYQGWMPGQTVEFFNPKRPPLPNDDEQPARDKARWIKAVKTVSNGLTRLLDGKLGAYWGHLLANGLHRRTLFIQAMSDKARADILFKRQASIITPEQSLALDGLFDRSAISNPQPQPQPQLIAQTLRLWEHSSNFVTLAGSFMIIHPQALLFTPDSGLQVLADYRDVQDTVLAKARAAGHEDELYALLSQEERNRFIGFREPQLSGETITTPIFERLFNDIVNKQIGNIEYALDVFRHSDGVVNVDALIDKGLDVRSMIDGQLATLATHGRWSTRPIITGQLRPSAVLAHKAALLTKSYDTVNVAINTRFHDQPTQTSALQRTWLESIKADLAHAMAVGIRGEAALRRLNRTLSEVDSAIVHAVLDPDRPTQSQRIVLDGFRPQAYRLTLECAAIAEALPLASCFILTQRGGLDRRHSGRVVLWTPAAGLEVFSAVNQATTELERRLIDPIKRLALLENLLPQHRLFHQQYTLGGFRSIEGNILLNRQQSAIEHFLAVCDDARGRLPAAQQPRALTALKRLPLLNNLQRAKALGAAISAQQTLPAWLGLASLDDQQRHIELLQQYRTCVPEGKDYLHEIKPLAVYVHEKLLALQKVRFNNDIINPDDVRITPALAIAGPAQSLTEFALNHLNLLQGSSFSVASTTAQMLPKGMDANAVRQMLLQLDIPQTYQPLLTEQLLGSDDQSAIRKRRYCQQMPWQLLREAHALKLHERLSDKAFESIVQVLDMPDALARSDVPGAGAIIRPLELILTAGAATVKALGMYLISEGAPATSTLVLYAPYFPGPGFREFESEARLIAALNTPGALQDLLVRRLPEMHQATYRNLFKSTAGKHTEMTLASNPIAGNVLNQLYKDNHRLLLQMSGTQSEPAAQSDWEATKELFSTGIRLVSGFLPGKLSWGLYLWQAYKDFKDSAEALQNHHWQRALTTFIDGTAQMITLGRIMQADPASSPAPAIATEPVEARPPTVPLWSLANVTSPSRTQAQAYEAPSVELGELQKDAANGSYLHPSTRRRYAPVSGKVYRVEQQAEGWRLVNEAEPGPLLTRTSDARWIFAPDPHALHYGKAVSRLYNKHATQSAVREALNVEAQGMDEIRRKYPEKAQVIVQAIDLARFYAFNSLHNLSVLRTTAPHTRLDRFLKVFFDADIIDSTILEKIKTAIVPICTALVDPGMDELDSKRFVVGSNISPASSLIAFVVDKDRQKKVYFTEQYFTPHLDWYKSGLTEPFDVDAHAQAATLIHEFSHHFSNTLDIAYLESRRPFSDLIATVTHYGAELKQNQQDFQRQGLSMATPREELFSRWNSTMSIWESMDLLPTTSHIGKEIKKITKSESMTDARIAFLDRSSPDRRVDTILRNADSIAMLICEMGRQLDPTPVTESLRHNNGG